jgi:putative spermidine/putrescine transport system permease protein
MVMRRIGILGLIGVVFVAPLGVLFIASGAGVWVWPHVWPQFWSGGAWRTVIASDAFVPALIMSVAIAVAVTALAFVLCWYAALGLSRSGGMRTIVLVICYAPLVVPPFLPLIGIHRWLIRLGWSDSVWGVIVVTVPLVVPYMLHALLLGLDTISAQWRDVARMLGASVFAQQRTLLAMLRPSIALGCGCALIVSWSQYAVPLTIGQIVTLPVLMMPYVVGGDRAIGAVYALVYTCGACALWASAELFIRGRKKGSRA